jgi:type III pantothenate kinase
MLAAIDRGNTYSKTALFSGNQITTLGHALSDQAVIEWVDANQPSHLILCNVRGDATGLISALKATCPVLMLDHRTKIPLKNSYKTPTTLGMDRLAAVCGAVELFPDKTNLVVDLGTCITFDVVTQNGEYLGGAISPGMKMRYKAMHSLTASLPLVDNDPDVELIGGSTAASMQSGVAHGITFEIEGWCQRLPKMGLTNINLVLTGGDAATFETKIKAPLFVRPQLVLEGLHSILSAHVS